MDDAPVQQCVYAPQPQLRTASPSRPRCRLLARGASCPQPGDQQQLRMDNLEIVRPLACSHNCFVSIVRLPDSGITDSQLAGTGSKPAAAVTTATSSSTSSTSSCKQGVAKSYRKAKLDEDEARQVELEIKLHHQLSQRTHHVVPFWAALDSLDSTTILTAHCESDLRATLEQAGGTLSEAVVQEQIAAPLLEVLVHMHKLGFVHRDIKPENVFVSGAHAMLGDFGLAIAMPSPSAAAQDTSNGRDSPCSSSSSRHTPASRSGRSSAGGCLVATGCSTGSSSSTTSRQGVQLRSCSSTSSLSNLPGTSSGGAAGGSSSGSRLQISGGVAVMRRSSSCGAVGFDCSVIPQLKQLQAGGTPAYSAPEVVQASFNNTPLEAAVGPQNDVWNLGVLIWEVLAGRHPFGDCNTSPGAFMCAVVSRSQGQLAAGINALPVSAACKGWLNLALQKDPSKRATAAQLLQHRWLAQSPFSDPQQQPAVVNNQEQQVECLQPSLLLQCCTADDLPSSTATVPGNCRAQVSWQCNADCCDQQQSPWKANSGWQTAAVSSKHSSHSCAVAASRLVPRNVNSSSCSSDGAGGISAMSQQQFASYLQTIGSWED